MALALFTVGIYLFGVLTGLAIFYGVLRALPLLQSPKKSVRKKPGPALPSRPRQGSAKNSAAVLNASVDFQKIKTAEIEIPVIAADVLTYEGGELGPAYPDRTRLYYAPEALSDPEYLQTVLRSPLQIQTHEKNTTEYNRGVDGWPFNVVWDETEQRVKARGVLHGEENVRYAEENKNKPSFGTSAFISFLQVDRQSGIAPNGKPYDAIVRKAVNNHIAILPNVRDPKNVILAMNALEGGEMETVNAGVVKKKMSDSEMRDYGITDKKKQAVLPDGSKWVWDDRFEQWSCVMAAGNAAPDDVENSYDIDSVPGKSRIELLRDWARSGNPGQKEAAKRELKEKYGIYNADPSFDPSMVKTAEEKKRELEELKKKEKSSKNSEGKRMPIDKEDFKAAMNEYEADKAKEAEAKDALKNAVLDELKGGKNTDDKDADDKGKNADDEPIKEKDDAAASNALPSESMVKDFSDALGVTFKKTPSLRELAALAGVQGNTVAELVTALNAKRATLKAPAAKNEAAAAPVSVDDLIKSM